MPRAKQQATRINHPILDGVGLSLKALEKSILYTYSILDAIDDKMVEQGESRLANLVELANLSAIVGNLVRGGIAKASRGRYKANAPHTYPDLLAIDPDNENLEIKIALETNSPKGHLVKPGLHLTIRYVLGHEDGSYIRGKENRGDVVWIWEMRVGHLRTEHFNVSNTRGDSGKTAVINADGMNAMVVVFCDLKKFPYSIKGPIYKKLVSQLKIDPSK